MIRLATLEDMPMLLSIKDLAIENMYRNGNFQWDKAYPSCEILTEDIGRGELYVVLADEVVVGFACINKEQALEYKNLVWATPDEAYVVHRLAINPQATGKGYASRLMVFAEELAKSKNVRAMRIDTFSHNVFARKLFSKLGYTFVGEVFFARKDEPFYCFEKAL